MKRNDDQPVCSEWRAGLCASFEDAATYCPLERAKGARFDCTHHPFHLAARQITEMRRSKIKLGRYGAKLRDPVFVAKLHAAWLRAKARRPG